MADNYLERRMDDYRRGAVKKFKPRAAKTRAVMVVDGLSERGRELVAQRSRAGTWHVAFCGIDTREGSRLAQATGSRFYPVDPADSAAVERAISDCRHHFAMDVEVI